jgi:hypothetical protein
LLESAGREIAIYDFAPLGLKGSGPEGLLLPSPSPFLRGRVRFPDGLTRDRLEVFIDALLERHDGAGVALSRLVSCTADERPRWFSSLLVTPALRLKLQPWLERERATLDRFEPVLRVSEGSHAGPLLHAIATEPIFQHVREVHVDAADQRWLDFMRYVEAIPNVLVVGWRNGAQIARFEPGRSQPLDPLVARFYERHL